jgi:hypothetical protein
MTDEKMPLILDEPDFKYEFDSWLPIQLTVEVGEDGHKTEAQSLIHIRTGNGGYPMTLAVQTGDYSNRKWQVVEDIYDIGILIEGSWERQGVIEALQRAGLMLMPYYGKMDSTQEEQDNAIREQT